jgi:hypothetical protein
MLIFNNNEFLNTINVDHENFYSDHLINNKDRLVSTGSIKKFALNKLHRQHSSFDLNQMLRNVNSMEDCESDNYRKVGPLKIL